MAWTMSSPLTDTAVVPSGTLQAEVQWQVRFLDHVARRGDVQAACAHVGLGRSTVYRWRRRNRAFAQAWQAALVLARQHVEAELATRALQGVEEPVWYRGEQVGTRRRYDSRLLLAHLGRLDKQAEDEDAQRLSERFDEMLAMMAGADPQAHLEDYDPEADLREIDHAAAQAEVVWNIDHGMGDYEPDGTLDVPLPPSRALYIWQCAEESYAHVAAGDDAPADEDADARPPVYADFHDAAAQSWDHWQEQAFACVDHILKRRGEPIAPSGTDAVVHTALQKPATGARASAPIREDASQTAKNFAIELCATCATQGAVALSEPDQKGDAAREGCSDEASEGCDEPKPKGIRDRERPSLAAVMG